MRKSTLTVLSLFVAASAGAGNFTLTSEMPSASRQAMERLERMTESPFASAEAKVLKAPAGLTRGYDNTVIYEAPEGRVEHYSTSGQAFMAIMGMVGQLPVENFDTEMVFCDNGEVYWKNCITQMVPNTYIKGTDLGDRIEFALPQCLLSYPDADGNIIDIFVSRMAYDAEEQWFFVDNDNNTVTLYKGEDGTLTGDVVGGESIIGMTTPDDEWYGYGNWNISMSPGLETPIEIPDNLEPEAWQMVSNTVGREISVAFDGNDVYLGNVFEYMPDAWIKGSIEGDMVVFPGHQYFGTLDMMSCSAYFEAITFEYDEDVDDDMPVKADMLTCTYDAANKVMKADKYIALMGGPGYLFEYYENPEIRWQPAEYEKNLQDPVILDCFNYDDYLNYGVLAFNLPALTKEGYTLDPEYISYRMFVDGEAFTFQPDEYTDLEEDMEWLPYLMNNYDIHCDGEYHQIDHYLFDIETFGIQAKYDDGITVYETPIVTTTTSGIGSITEESAKSTVFHDLSGRRVENPTAGFYIRTVTMADGTVKSTKVLVRK